MDRKEFLKKAAASAIVLSFASTTDIFAVSVPKIQDLSANEPAEMSDDIKKEFEKLLAWLDQKKWTKYLNDDLELNINWSSKDYKQYTTPINKSVLATLIQKKGFEDFAGNKLIEPGYPALSLLYHALASPRVRPGNFQSDQYPTYKELDTLENVIYAMKKFDTKKENQESYVLAVFAYEYRPAFKTPHHRHADLVFSRTGIARIGETKLNYSPENRCYTNRPKDAKDKKKIAVTPARYGLFLAKIVPFKEIKTEEIFLSGKAKEDAYNLNDNDRFFLQPVRKVFQGDTLITGKVAFNEYHKNEKLYRLALKNNFINPKDTSGRYKFDIKKPPFILDSNSADDKIVEMIPVDTNGSSALISSIPDKIIRPAKQGDNYLSFNVPADINRYFSTLDTKGSETEIIKIGGSGSVEDVDVLKGVDEKQKLPNPYGEPRNSPLYLNIRYRTTLKNGQYTYLDGQSTSKFEDEVIKGYPVGMFVDSICDGCVIADTKTLTSTFLPQDIIQECLPAFSIITAPDFFPQVDSNDLAEYDLTATQKVESNFLEGGLVTLSQARIRPNPNIENPLTKNDAAFPPAHTDHHSHRARVYDTATAVYSCTPSAVHDTDAKYTSPKSPKDYFVTGFLPDVCSFVFAPGWDITYCNDATDLTHPTVPETSPYLSTRGLGSPFPEDMKLCAAMNGMWPVASPDAARTFQGSVYEKDIIPDIYLPNPTAVPLMDEEIGFHKYSPYNSLKASDKDRKETFGWDGEQGPFLEYKKDASGFVVNFTDLGRADYVANAMGHNNNPGFDMSQLRELSSDELIARMGCLKKCIKSLNGPEIITLRSTTHIVAYTALWLVSAEQVDWGNKDANGYGVPMDLIGNDKTWITHKSKAQVKGKGYLYVFADAVRDKETPNWVDAHKDPLRKRRWQKCNAIYVCQVTENELRWCEVTQSKAKTTDQLKWNQG